MGRVILLGLLTLAGGCLLELDNDSEIACGDGYVHRSAGEECDPENVASFENACRDGTRRGACDPNTCKIDYSVCDDACGNGEVDPGEECDPNHFSGPDVIGTSILCTTLDALDGGGTYEGGETNRCKDDCTWDRSPCHRCGDEELQPNEACEPGRYDHDETSQLCLDWCVLPEEDEHPQEVRCTLRCNDTCTDYYLETSEDRPACCIPSGQPIHPRIPCCTFRNENTGRCDLGLGKE